VTYSAVLFGRRLRCSLLTDLFRVCSSLAPRLRQKFLAAYVTEFTPHSTKDWGEAGKKGSAIETSCLAVQTPLVKLKTLKDLRDTAPFRRFDIHLSDGHVLPVVTADHLLVMPNNNDEFFVVLPDGGFRIVDVFLFDRVPSSNVIPSSML
jgi:hypothetical protein